MAPFLFIPIKGHTCKVRSKDSRIIISIFKKNELALLLIKFDYTFKRSV